MIKLGNKDITLKLGSTNISAAYLGSIQVYGGGHSYDLCYGVTDDISTYTGTFKDVFDKSSETWNKLNNLNEYEEYGVYGSGRNITTYEGKLTIDGGYEYQYTNGAWVNVGEITGTTATLPDVPFTVNINAKQYNSTTKKFAKTTGQLADTDVTITQGTVTPHDDYVTVTGNTRGVITGYQQYFNRDSNNPNFTIISKHRTADNVNVHLFANRDGNYNWMYRPASNQLKFHGSSQINGVSVTTQPVIGSVRVDSSKNLIFNNYTNNTTTTSTNFSYGSTNSGGVALFAGYVSSGNEYFQGDFYWIYISQNTLTDAQVQQVIDYNEDTGSVEYPIYYDEKADPLDNITFNSLAEAEAYAYTHCVYDGMKATIAGEKYVFDSTNGWTIVQEYYIVTDVTPGGASGWTITGSSTYNPNTSYYDDFSVENTTTINVTKIAKVTIYGYDHFTYYLRSKFYTYNYGYAYATNIDELSSDPTTDFGYNSSSAITNTYDFQKDPTSLVNLSNYRRVTYNNLDKTVEHTFYVVFYGRRRSGSQANATILIPKEQTNENWEQVEFSASTNIASQEKNLYIDGNTSTSGGTNRFYYRWIIGLPAGTHTGYTNYSNYNYCPSVSSATFTSVAGNSRKIDFVYDNTQTKSLQFNLVDSSGNTLTPSDTVYINLFKYNECDGHTGSSVTFPRTDTVVRGGSFSFTATAARQYIYGYQPPSLPTQYYYTDNYQSTFDIVYTKLSEEAVTLSYVTYDPNDSETPSFMTEVTYPYNGGTTSATTLTSFNVPYTYPYTIEQTSNLFSADTYTYTAGQASRTITFTLYPNNREFQTVADLEAYQYAWEGMRAYIGSTNYQYKNGQWVEIIYNEYEYIETENASGKFYDFITNFYPTKSHTIETKFQLVNQSIDWGSIVGWKDDVNPHTTFTLESVTKNFRIIVRTSNNNSTGSYPYVFQDVTIATMPLSATSGTYQRLPGSTLNTLTYNTGTSFTLQSNVSMCLFGQGTANRKQAAVARMYYVKVYDENNNLVKHYVASDYNGTPCFYEKVDGEFVLDTYTGSNHGTCTLGNPVTPQTPQWVTFNSGDDISGLNVYGVKGVAINLSNTLPSYLENICFELSRNIVNANIGDYSNPCYTDTYGINDNVELIFGNIGCSDYYTLPASITAVSTIQLYIH